VIYTYRLLLGYARVMDDKRDVWAGWMIYLARLASLRHDFHMFTYASDI
jgi:hypothetical protein